MDEEKINKTLEIILQNQAQFYADLQKMQETNKEAEKRVSVLERATVNLYNAQAKTNEAIEKTSATVNELAVKVDGLTDKVEGLILSQKETDERLSAVIFMAEKFFSRNNGKSEN